MFDRVRAPHVLGWFVDRLRVGRPAGASSPPRLASLYVAGREVAPASPSEALPLDEFFKRMLDELHDGVYFVDLHRRILYWNPAAEELSGYSASEMINSRCYDNLLDHLDDRGCHLCHQRCPLVEAMQQKRKLRRRVFLRHKNGDRIAVETRVAPVYDSVGRLVGAVEVFRDARPDVALETAYSVAREQAEKDPLTGLANRRALDLFLAEQQAECRGAGRRFSVVLADLDHFKEVNDRLGHLRGDAVLVRVARLLQSNCREFDLAGRFGGDELAVVLPSTRLDQAAVIAERIRTAVADDREGAGDVPRITVSLGAAESCPAEELEALLSRADAALYDAKLSGRNRVQAVSGRR